MLLPYADENPSFRPPVVTYAIIALNVVSFLAVSLLPPADEAAVVYQRGFVPARIAQLRTGQPLKITVERRVQHPQLPVMFDVQEEMVFSPSPVRILSTLFSSMFMHGGWFHLLGNMWFLWLFGDNVEDRLGHLLYAVFYLGGGLAATACHWLGDPLSIVPVIGASGAVAGVLGAYAVTFPWARVHTLVVFFFITVIDLPALWVLGGWFALQLLSAQMDAAGNVAWWAHVGGFAAGFVAMPALDRGRLDKEAGQRE